MSIILIMPIVQLLDNVHLLVIVWNIVQLYLSLKPSTFLPPAWFQRRGCSLIGCQGLAFEGGARIGGGGGDVWRTTPPQLEASSLQGTSSPIPAELRHGMTTRMGFILRMLLTFQAIPS